MSKLAPDAVPSYRHHKQSGQAITTLNSRDFLLGPHGTPASKQEYSRLIAEWLANGRQLPGNPARSITVNELILAYWRFAKGYYRKNGQPTSEIDALKAALAPLQKLYGKTLAAEFRPLALLAVREQMIQLGWCRKSINNHANRIKRMFKWAVARELVPPDVHHGLTAVDGLRKGRSSAQESEPVRSVPDAHVDAVIAVLSPSLAQLIRLQAQIEQLQGDARIQLLAQSGQLAGQVLGESPVAAMIQLQRLTGMRSGELVTMRSGDIETTGENWIYTPPLTQDGAP